jgi:hypothetical protein
MSVTEENGKEPIAFDAKACADVFHSLQKKWHETDGGRLLEEQHARFNLWASNLGVFLTSNASLDYRLREAPTLIDTFRQLLKLLLQVLKHCEQLLAQSRPNC